MKWLTVILCVSLLALVTLILWLAREPEPAPVVLPDDATAVLANPQFAEPVGWQWQTLQSAAGSVRWGFTAPAEPRAVVMFLPGLSAPLEIYFETLSRLRAQEYAVVAMDWPGQGGSARGSSHPQKLHATSLDGHLDVAIQLRDIAETRFPGRPKLLVSLSMGAQLGARLLADQADSFDAAALLTPAFSAYGNRPTAPQRFLLRTMTAVGFGERYVLGASDWQFNMDAHNGVASTCSHPNDRTRLWYAAMAADKRIRIGGMTNAFLLAFDESARLSRSTEVLSRITLPVWMPLAGEDVFVENAVARQACGQLADCRLQVYPQARHCLLEESDAYYYPLIDDLLMFLVDSVAAGTS